MAPADGGARKAFLVRGVADFIRYLARQNHAMAPAFKGAAEHGFRSASGIDVGGIEEIDARVEAAFHHLHGGWFVGLSAESHGAEAQAGNFQTGFREGDLIHVARIGQQKISRKGRGR